MILRVVCLLMLLGSLGCMPDNRLSAPDGSRPGDATQSVNQIEVAQRLADAGEHELALRAYFRAAASDGLTTEILTGLATSNLALGRLGQAEQQFDQSLAQEPDNIAALNNYGVLLLELGKPGEARGIFRRAFALDSGRSDEIRANLQLAIARSENSAYTGGEAGEYVLIRQGGGTYKLSTGTGAPQS